ncbi:MAG: hypothetical protein ABGY42_17910, partial [bacterium]
MVHPLTLISLIALLSAGWADSAAAARCTTKASLRRAGVAIAKEIRCASQTVLNGEVDPACQAPAVPACAQEALAQSLEIVFGPGALPDGSTWPKARRLCLQKLTRESGHFFSGRIRERLKGHRSARRGRSFHRVATVCDAVNIDAVGDSSRRTGLVSACLQTRDGKIDGRATAGCIRSSLEAAIDDIAPEPLAPNVIL